MLEQFCRIIGLWFCLGSFILPSSLPILKIAISDKCPSLTIKSLSPVFYSYSCASSSICFMPQTGLVVDIDKADNEENSNECVIIVWE